MVRAWLALVGAFAATFLFAGNARAEDYTVPITVGTKTYTITVTLVDNGVTVTSDNPQIKVGKVEPVKAAVADAAGDAQARMAQAVTVGYDDLFRNNEQHVGKVVRYVGQVLQFGDVDCLLCLNPEKYLRVAVTNQGYGLWTDPIYVIYQDEERFLEDDIITLWGTVDGLESYIGVLGNEITIPRIKAFDVVLGEQVNPVVAAAPGKPAANKQANLRGGPGTDFALVGSIGAGQALNLVARNGDGSWLQLEGGAWIAAFLVDNVPANLPLAENPPAAPAATPVAAAPAPAAAAPAAPGAPAATTGVLQIGQEAEAAGWHFKVTEVHKRKTVYFYDDAYLAMGRFLIVVIEATNLQSGTDYFDRNIDPYIEDAAGNVYSLSAEGTGNARWQYGGKSSTYGDVNPGNTVQLLIAYDMPESAGKVYLKTDPGVTIDLGDFAAITSEDN